MIEFSNKKIIYTPCYCEENVYHLCKAFGKLDDIYVCFISNENRSIPIWKQRASKFHDGIVIWDYHVILLVKEKSNPTKVYDLDTTLSFPCDFSIYVQESFKILDDPQYHRKYRIIPAEKYLKVFASDRSHMDGTWFASPPIYSPISTSESVNNLPLFINMTENLDSKDFVSAYFTETLIFIGFMLLVPIFYAANFYFRYKRHRAATPWSIQEKVVVITGASSGIGAALAYEFARQGATLILCARQIDLLANVSKECKEKYCAKNVLIQKVDVTSETDVMRLVETVDAAYSKIDCLVLNAGVSMGETLESIEDFDLIKKIMEVNYIGSTMLAFYSLPLLKKADKARIVINSSLAGIIPVPLRTGYCGSKFALRGFFESLQSELVDDNIFITMAYAGAVKTDINKNRLGENPKKLDFNNAMSAEECAKIIVDGTVKGHKEIVFTNIGKIGRLMESVFPDLLAFLSYKRARKFYVKEIIDKSL
ncbi:12539_t:CDS:2 [Funneliformis geosporum]|uniref:11316_t:CDS:1 n=1 Tax=Funneliformis geosporum TaxID=1117311 RepID=A0A9W4WTT2_9GLOM|nr:12539_t:CDS:2 [Funneliformis geosporum]CAI2163062.1 11316_t:CDS:2 [Funneliformis geosporum]